jgi:hypothetical protein
VAANSLLDRGWGRAAQLVDVQGEVRQLVEVKLNVVQAAPASHALSNDEPLAIDYKEIKDLIADACYSSVNGKPGEPK